MHETKHVEIAVIGGGSAGLSAALTLGRARRRVLVIDDGAPRNHTAEFAYGVYTRDKTPPADLYRIGCEQLRSYDVNFYEGRAVAVIRADGVFCLTMQDGTIVKADKLLLATGVTDDLSFVTGLAEFWGRSAFSCPYCDGWEMRDKKLAVIGSGQKGYEFALTIQQWSKNIILCTNDDGVLTEHQKHNLMQYEIPLIENKILAITGQDQATPVLEFENRPDISVDGIFVQPPCYLRNDLIAHLGCETEKCGTQLVVDENGCTNIEGVYAAGDAATKHSQITIAAASGVTAAMTLNHDLIKETLQNQIRHRKN